MKYIGGKGLILIILILSMNLLVFGGRCLAADEGPSLIIPDLDPGDVLLHWTATGDDENIGRAAGYDIRYFPYQFGPIDNEIKWNLAIRVIGEPMPGPSGQPDSMTVRGLTPGASYYFCIKAFDDAGNYSALSNSALAQAADGDFIAGDVNASGRIDGLDVVYLVNYLKGGPPPPAPLLRADCNGDCLVNGSDVLFFLEYFRGGPVPHRGNCEMILSEKKFRTIIR
jgi:hypothetical protein